MVWTCSKMRQYISPSLNRAAVTWQYRAAWWRSPCHWGPWVSWFPGWSFWTWLSNWCGTWLEHLHHALLGVVSIEALEYLRVLAPADLALARVDGTVRPNQVHVVLVVVVHGPSLLGLLGERFGQLNHQVLQSIAVHRSLCSAVNINNKVFTNSITIKYITREIKIR